MYDSPIELFISEIQEKFENGIFEAVQRFDIDVNREELIRALKYDRDQYHKGFSDGRMSGRFERDEEIVRCADCKYWQDNNDGYPHEECRWGHGETPDANDFCSYGERKTNGNEDRA